VNTKISDFKFHSNLGKAIENKAGHLFAKWYIHTFRLAKKSDARGSLSYETPFDSKACHVLFRTGFLLYCADLSDYEEWNVVQKGKGKSGEYYIRATKPTRKQRTK